ncbi:hypothetical protein HZC27_06245 [Candidatus Roizmanbacteria bacterium]|nr:hypothetical protein [Candidatus Roizmanbacteria bacterium]
MITNADVKKLKDVFATKDEMKELRNDVIGFKDAILHEITKLREDITVVIGYRDMIEDHENRIGKIESTILVKST